jgi:transcriptional regulator with XRE-family HTH domain
MPAVAQMTGPRLRTLRTDLGMTSHAFAAVLGVSISTYYRWESTTTELNPDPLQREILDKLATTLHSLSANACEGLGKKLSAFLVQKGTLAALGALIEEIT